LEGNTGDLVLSAPVQITSDLVVHSDSILFATKGKKIYRMPPDTGKNNSFISDWKSPSTPLMSSSIASFAWIW
jgi:hypothetical protein